MSERKYSREKLKEIFAPEIDGGGMDVSEAQFDQFCDALCLYLPDDIIDVVIDELYFIVQANSPACYVNLASRDLRRKKGIIFLSPPVFLNDKDPFNPHYPILHEIAHHLSGHKDISDTITREKCEAEANALVASWMGFTKGKNEKSR